MPSRKPKTAKPEPQSSKPKSGDSSAKSPIDNGLNLLREMAQPAKPDLLTPDQPTPPEEVQAQATA